MSEDKNKVIEFPTLKLKPICVEDEPNNIIDKLVSLVQAAYGDGYSNGYTEGQIDTHKKMKLVHAIEREPGLVQWTNETARDLVMLAFKPAEENEDERERTD